MNLQISIVGMAIIAVLYWICGAVLLKVWRRVRGRTWGKVVVPLVAFVVLILPWADEVWIAWHFSEFCKDAGVRVVRKVEVEGYYDDTASGISEASAAS